MDSFLCWVQVCRPFHIIKNYNYLLVATDYRLHKFFRKETYFCQNIIPKLEFCYIFFLPQQSRKIFQPLSLAGTVDAIHWKQRSPTFGKINREQFGAYVDTCSLISFIFSNLLSFVAYSWTSFNPISVQRRTKNRRPEQWKAELGKQVRAEGPSSQRQPGTRGRTATPCCVLGNRSLGSFQTWEEGLPREGL